MSWFHNRPTKPTFLPQPMKEEITTIDIESCFQDYRTLRGDIHERYSFQEYIFKYGFSHKKENVNSLRDNQQSTSLEEREMRKNHPICEKSLDTPLKEETNNHEVENQLPQGDFIEEHKEEKEYKHTILTDGGCANQRESTDGSLNYDRVPTCNIPDPLTNEEDITKPSKTSGKIAP